MSKDTNGIKIGQELSIYSASVGTGRSLVAEHCEALSQAQITDDMIEVAELHDVAEMDFSETEMRVLAHMREDAERMQEDEPYRRPEDLSGFNTGRVKALLSLRDAAKILREGTVNPVDTHKSRAAELFAVNESEVTESMRQFSKTYYFGEMYGCRETFAEFLAKRGLPDPIEPA